MENGNGLAAYIPIDRQHALAQELTLPDRTQGTALFANISGFTPISEALVRELGPQLGAEQLTEHLNRVFGAIIAEVHQFQGSVVSFSGDAITCWFDQDAGERALTSALAIQAVMEQFATIMTPSGRQFSLGIKVALASDPVQLSCAWTYLGHAQLGLGQAAEAEQSYRNALQLRESEPERGARLEIRAGLALAALAQSRPDQAMAQVEVILPALTDNSLDGADERLKIYLTCYKILQDAGDPRAGQVLEAAYAQLRERTARLSPDQRRTYLENIPAHREILRLRNESIL